MSEFDAVIIGAGNAGLSAALTLATAGKHVLVVEQHNLPGGCASSFVRGRFEFDVSLHEYCGLGEPGHYGPAGSLLMETYQLPLKWFYSDELFRVIGTARSGKRYDVTLHAGIENVIADMEQAVPGSGEPTRVMLELAKECMDAGDYSASEMDKVTRSGRLKTNTLYYIRHFMNFIKVAERPFNKVLRRIGMPEDAIDILGVYWPYAAMDLEKLSFIHYAGILYLYTIHRPAIPAGTAHNLSVTMAEKLRELGSELWLNVRAEKVRGDENGRITGVETSAGFVKTRHVIANVNPETAYTGLLDENIRVPEREIRKANALKHGARFLNAYLGLSKSIEELGIRSYTIFLPGVLDSTANYEESKSIDKVLDCVVIYNVINPDISPKGTTVMTFTVGYTEDVWAEVSEEEYNAVKHRILRRAVERFERETGIVIHDCIEEVEIATPWTFAHYLGTPQGTCYGYEVDDRNTMLANLRMLHQDQPIKGFKTCGAHGARGDGYSQTHLNGNDIAKMTLREMAAETEVRS